MSQTHRLVSACSLVLVLALVSSAGTQAQERRQGGGGSGLPPYNTATEVTLSGKVASNGSSPTMSGQEFAMVTVTVDAGPLHVLLAPMDFMKKQGFTMADGAAVQITGMPGLRFQGEPAMLARQVKTGSRTLTLRDASGRPAWEPSGQR
jgi:hypothetical protein